MQNIPREICERFKEARRSLGITQSQLAAKVGCKQAAISMFEKGKPTKLSNEYVQKMAKILQLDIKEMMKEADAARSEEKEESAFAAGFCPDPECPSNASYMVGRRTFFRITLQRGNYCAHCGEVLEKSCPACGAPVNEGACCTMCGARYVQG